jgi:hypothetical protein
MKKFLIIIVILTVFAAVIVGYFKPSLFFGDSENKGSKDGLEAQNNTKRTPVLMATLDFYSASNIISLLSIKYSMTPDVLIELISEYNNKTQLDYEFESTGLTEVKNKMKNDINKLNSSLAEIANNYNIQATTLVNIIIDYKLLKNADR